MSQDSPFQKPANNEHNRTAWDRRATHGQRFTKPVEDEQLANPLKYLDGSGWLGSGVRGKRVLCLAAGGGRQSILYAMAGAIVTVVDISGEMLRIDREVATERGLDIRAVETSMDDLSAFADAEFDIVAQPVSTCYVPNVQAVFREVARVTAGNGLYISQHKSPTSLQTSVVPSPEGYELVEPYYRTGPLPTVEGSSHREAGTLEYLHRWEELIGGICRAGFVIEDFVEPLHANLQANTGAFKHRSRYVAPYFRIKARRSAREQHAEAKRSLWVP